MSGRFGRGPRSSQGLFVLSLSGRVDLERQRQVGERSKLVAVSEAGLRRIVKATVSIDNLIVLLRKFKMISRN
jgi:hypothetical protein